MIPDYKFVIDVQNNKNTMLDVTSKDIKVTDTKTNNELNNEDFFPNSLLESHSYCRLKPNPGGGEGERIHKEDCG